MTEKRLEWAKTTYDEKNLAVLVATQRHGAVVLEHTIPNYLADPRAWWPLVEERNDGMVFINAERLWCCRMGEVAAHGHTFPGEAVCIAYLRAKGWEVVT